MFKIGILGSDNSHALAFAKLCNLPDADGNYIYDDIRITAIYGHNDDVAHTEKVAADGKIDSIVHAPEELFGKVDAVMAVYRDGSLHVPHALPFIERGIPAWIDKPVACSVADTQKLTAAMATHGTLVTGGSTMKYNYEIQTMRHKVQGGKLGIVNGGTMNFPGAFDDPYGGIFFYGSHLCEMCLTVFGYDARTVTTLAVSPQNTAVFVRYDDKLVTLYFNKAATQYYITVFGSEKSSTCEADISFIYRLGFDRFANMLRTKKMPLTPNELVFPVRMIEAIRTSYEKGGKEIKI